MQQARPEAMSSQGRVARCNKFSVVEISVKEMFFCFFVFFNQFSVLTVVSTGATLENYLLLNNFYLYSTGAGSTRKRFLVLPITISLKKCRRKKLEKHFLLLNNKNITKKERKVEAGTKIKLVQLFISVNCKNWLPGFCTGPCRKTC